MSNFSLDLKKIMEKFGLKKNVQMEDAPLLVDKTFSEFVDEFLANAEHIYKTLEAETHKSQYCLIGNSISVAIRRLPYKEGTGNNPSTCNKPRKEG